MILSCGWSADKTLLLNVILAAMTIWLLHVRLRHGLMRSYLLNFVDLKPVLRSKLWDAFKTKFA